MSDFESLLNFNNENETSLMRATSGSSNNSSSSSKFPTSGLKSLLQNSDLLELLLKPLSSDETKSSDDTSTATTAVPQVAATEEVVCLSNNNDPSSSPTSSLSGSGIDLLASTQLEGLDDLSLIDASKCKALFDWENSDEYLQMKANKMANSDGENASKIYGNAFLGPNLWDKNDLFQGEKFGVKFEYLEIDEFLNENGLNETDVEFLDQIQKIDNPLGAANMSSANSSNNGQQQQQQQQQNLLQNSNLLPNMSKSPTVSSSSVSSPSSSSSSSSSSSGSTSPSIQSSSSSSRPSNQLDLSNNNKERGMSQSGSSSSSKNSASRSNSLSLVSQQHNYSLPSGGSGGGGVTKTHSSARKDSLSNTDTSLESSSGGHVRSSHNDSFDWNSNSNDMSVTSIDDFDDFDPKTRKFSDDDLRPLPILRKSKKQFVPSEMKDEKYWHRRKKNNIAAKRSRDARRMKENQIAIRASYLERENDLLRKQLDDFKRETKLLKIKLTRYESMAQQQQQQPSLLDLSTIDDSK